jgi:hypothetical protein
VRVTTQAHSRGGDLVGFPLHLSGTFNRSPLVKDAIDQLPVQTHRYY